jgi:hypothetical protein
MTNVNALAQLLGTVSENAAEIRHCVTTLQSAKSSGHSSPELEAELLNRILAAVNKISD